MDFLLGCHDTARVILKLFYSGYKKICRVECRVEQGSRRYTVVVGRGDKWVKLESNKVQNVRLGQEVPSSPHCPLGSAVTANTGIQVQRAWVTLCAPSICVRKLKGCFKVYLSQASMEKNLVSQL